MNNTHSITIPTTAFKLKGSLFTLTVLELLTDELEAIERQLAKLLKKTPKFFHNAPIVIDVNNFAKLDYQPNIDPIWQSLLSAGLIPVAVRANTPELQTAVKTQSLPLLADSQGNQAVNTPPKAPCYSTKLITHPVRSGQQIVAEEGNLVIFASVSAGAEVMAAGNIHIYGHLRGRALAGIDGDQSAQIFCNQLQAELVSIAGFYLLADEISQQANTTRPTTRVFLTDKHVKFDTL